MISETKRLLKGDGINFECEPLGKLDFRRCFHFTFREPVKVEKKKKCDICQREIRGHCHTFYFMLKMAYNSSRNAKKILGANPLNCHTFFFYFDAFPNW